MILHVLTPTVRPENLDQVGSSLFAAMRQAPEVRVSWHVSIDARREHWGGWGLRNEMLEQLFEHEGQYGVWDHEWVFLLDDDTTVHPDLLKVWWQALHDEAQFDLFLVAQTRPEAWAPGCADPMKLKHGKDVGLGECAFDAGQAIFKLGLLRDYRFIVNDHDSDGYLWRDVLARVPLERVAWTDEVLAYYNALRPL